MRNRVSRIAGFSIMLFVSAASSARAQEQTPEQQTPEKKHICLAPATARMAGISTEQAVEAVRDAFTVYLSGPSFNITPLTARLDSQVREEARQSQCSYVLFASLTHKRKEGGLFGKVAADAARGAVWGTPGGGTVASAAARSAAVNAASTALQMAGNTKSKDELTLEYRLEVMNQPAPLVKNTDKAKAKADGEDLLSPLVQKAAESVAAAIGK